MPTTCLSSTALCSWRWNVAPHHASLPGLAHQEDQSPRLDQRQRRGRRVKSAQPLRHDRQGERERPAPVWSAAQERLQQHSAGSRATSRARHRGDDTAQWRQRPASRTRGRRRQGRVARQGLSALRSARQGLLAALVAHRGFSAHLLRPRATHGSEESCANTRFLSAQPQETEPKTGPSERWFLAGSGRPSRRGRRGRSGGACPENESEEVLWNEASKCRFPEERSEGDRRRKTVGSQL